MRAPGRGNFHHTRTVRGASGNGVPTYGSAVPPAAGYVAAISGFALSFWVPNLARRFPGNTWFVLRRGRFEVPRESLPWELLRLGFALGGLATAAALRHGTSLSLRVVAGLAALGLGLALARQAAPFPISLTPAGVRIWQICRFRTVPWSPDRRPASSWWRPVAVPWVEVDAVLAHYMANPDDRAKIGTGAEYDRLINYLEPDHPPARDRAIAPDHAKANVVASSLPQELRRPQR